MDFNSPYFLFIFLPIFLLIYFLLKSRYRKWLILFASLALYAWSQKTNVFVIIGIILINYIVLWAIQRIGERNKAINGIYVFTIIVDILFLVFFRIFSTTNQIHNFLDSKLPNFVFLKNISFPLGLSFVIFQIVSCLIDSKHSEKNAPHSLQDYVTYLIMFPKILVGPITRYNAIEPQLEHLEPSWEKATQGSKRFIRGLAKKILIADQLAVVVDAGFKLPTPGFSIPLAWFILISFFLQIYFDFSGYVDMGIGIATMLGITLPENFNMPYLAKNLSEFWRRWHMTLMAWFREYVFFPLERKRRKIKILRQEVNTLLVFILTGLWHGLTLNYLVWGLMQGCIVVFENSRFGQWLKKIPVIFQRIYLVLVVLMGWVIFRSPKVSYAILFYERLFFINRNVQTYPFAMTQPLPIINNSVLVAFIIGIICLFPFKEWKLVQNMRSKLTGIKLAWIYFSIANLGYLLLLAASLCFMAVQTFVPSIYGKF